ncbi:MAG: hypothetical protein M1368_09000 [Thaumarchaeota archaeon]|nr:hypothetical protein [Nitrososphaerota archaeon]
MISSLFKSGALSILVSIIVLSYGFVLIQNIFDSFAKAEPWFVLSYASGIIASILTDSGYPAHVVTTTASHPMIFNGAGVTLTTYNATMPEGLTIMIIYFAVTTICGLILFERKEFN